MRPVNFLRIYEELKKSKIANSDKIEREKCQTEEKRLNFKIIFF